MHKVRLLNNFMEETNMKKTKKIYLVPMTEYAPMACASLLCASSVVPTPDLNMAGNTSDNTIEYGD